MAQKARGRGEQVAGAGAGALQRSVSAFWLNSVAPSTKAFFERFCLPKIVVLPPTSPQTGFWVQRCRRLLLNRVMMNCSICRRAHNPKKLPFLCAVDARNHLYEGRIEIAKALLENEEAERQSEMAAVKGGGRAAFLESEEKAARDRTSQIIAQADRLRAEVEAAKKDMDAKTAVIVQRRSDLASVSSGLSTRKSRQLEEAERAIQRTRFKWNRSAETMAATRAFLCEEAARLYGLRQIKKGSSKRYEIGGVEILELHAMYSKFPVVRGNE